MVKMDLRQIFIFSSATFNSATVFFGFGWRFQKRLCIASRTRYIFMEFKSGHGHCSISIICGQFARRHCWATYAVHRASRCICHSVRQQSIDCSLRWTLEAEVNKQLYYCLQNKNVTIKLCYSDVTLVSSRYYFSLKFWNK